jgi:drug/metabolite transporter (DMT)-like permease
MMANKLTTAANAIVLQYIAPVFLIAYESVFHHKRFRKGDYIAVLCTMAGVALFFLDQLKGGAILGNVLAILAGAFFAGTMFTVAGTDENGRLSGLLQGHLLTALIGLPFLFVYGAPASPVAVTAILVLGVFQLGIPYILYGLAASGCTPLALTLLAALEPILNPLWVFLFVGEAPGRTALLGGLLVIASVTLWCMWDVKAKAALAGTGVATQR